MRYIIIDKRIGWVDWAKSVCMFLVVLGHCHIRVSEQFVTQFIYSFHMMLFFFLSGLLCKRDLSLISLKKDLRYIMFPYFVYGALLIAFSSIRSRTFDLSIMFVQMESLLVGDDISIGPIWFLPALFICKQLFLLLKMVKKYPIVYLLLFALSFSPVYFISKYNVNIPFFADSALCGLPFFIAGNESYAFWGNIKQLKWYKCLCIAAVLICISAFLCDYNGFVSLAGCDIGQSVFVYYINAFVALIAISIICLLFDNVKSEFITISSYGSIVILGIHGIPLTIFNYYVPIFMGYEPSTYPIYLAVIYSIFTYCFCYYLIIIIEKHCPLLFGLKSINH